MGLKLAADVDLELFFSKLDERLAERDKALEQYLCRPLINPRKLRGSVEAAASPLVIDLGAPAGGMLWSVRQAIVHPEPPLTVTAVANLVAALFVGGIPSGIGFQPDLTALASAPFTVPGSWSPTNKAVNARATEHVYVVLTGAGTALHQFYASVHVLELVDTPEALVWI